MTFAEEFYKEMSVEELAEFMNAVAKLPQYENLRLKSKDLKIKITYSEGNSEIVGMLETTRTSIERTTKKPKKRKSPSKSKKAGKDEEEKEKKDE